MASSVRKVIGRCRLVEPFNNCFVWKVKSYSTWDLELLNELGNEKYRDSVRPVRNISLVNR